MSGAPPSPCIFFTLSFHYTLPATPSSSYSHQNRIPNAFYSSLVSLTHNFYARYISRPRIVGRPENRAMTLDDRVLQAERKAIEDGLAFQRHPTPDHLRQYQTSRDVLVALQQSIQTDSR